MTGFNEDTQRCIPETNITFAFEDLIEQTIRLVRPDGWATPAEFTGQTVPRAGVGPPPGIAREGIAREGIAAADRTAARCRA